MAAAFEARGEDDLEAILGDLDAHRAGAERDHIGVVVQAAEYMRWSDETDNASHRELMIRVAKSWMAIAATLERRLSAGDEFALPDLRSKLD